MKKVTYKGENFTVKQILADGTEINYTPRKIRWINGKRVMFYRGLWAILKKLNKRTHGRAYIVDRFVLSV